MTEQEKMALAWKLNDERNRGLRYPDGSLVTFYPGKSHLNKYGYAHTTKPCKECGEWECDSEGTGHYRG